MLIITINSVELCSVHRVAQRKTCRCETPCNWGTEWESSLPKTTQSGNSHFSALQGKWLTLLKQNSTSSDCSWKSYFLIKSRHKFAVDIFISCVVPAVVIQKYSAWQALSSEVISFIRQKSGKLSCLWFSPPWWKMPWNIPISMKIGFCFFSTKNFISEIFSLRHLETKGVF